jgi:hypothetical protein
VARTLEPPLKACSRSLQGSFAVGIRAKFEKFSKSDKKSRIYR